jgi:flagellar biosynthesis chaperone FliJ
MLKNLKHQIKNETAKINTAGPGRLLVFLNKKKKHLNSLIDDFEDLAYRLRKELSEGIDKKNIKEYRKRLNQINENIIYQRSIITKLEREIEKVEVLQG